MHTVLRCMAPIAGQTRSERPHRAYITTAEGFWIPTGELTPKVDSEVSSPTPGYAPAYCSKCKLVTWYRRPEVASEEKVPA